MDLKKRKIRRSGIPARTVIILCTAELVNHLLDSAQAYRHWYIYGWILFYGIGIIIGLYMLNNPSVNNSTGFKTTMHVGN